MGSRRGGRDLKIGMGSPVEEMEEGINIFSFRDTEAIAGVRDGKIIASGHYDAYFVDANGNPMDYDYEIGQRVENAKPKEASIHSNFEERAASLTKRLLLTS